MLFRSVSQSRYEASSLNIVQKSQLEIANDNIKKLEEKTQEQENTIQNLKKQIEVLRQPKPAPQVQKPEQK